METLRDHLQLCDPFHELAAVTGPRIFYVLSFDEFRDDVGFAAIDPHVFAPRVGDQGWTRIVALSEIEKQVALKQDRFPGAVLVHPQHKLALRRLQNKVGLDGALWDRFGADKLAQIVGQQEFGALVARERGLYRHGVPFLCTRRTRPSTTLNRGTRCRYPS